MFLQLLAIMGLLLSMNNLDPDGEASEGNSEAATGASSLVNGGPRPLDKKNSSMRVDSSKSNQQKKKHRITGRTSQPSGRSATAGTSFSFNLKVYSYFAATGAEGIKWISRYFNGKRFRHFPLELSVSNLNATMSIYLKTRDSLVTFVKNELYYWYKHTRSKNDIVRTWLQ